MNREYSNREHVEGKKASSHCFCLLSGDGREVISSLGNIGVIFWRRYVSSGLKTFAVEVKGDVDREFTDDRLPTVKGFGDIVFAGRNESLQTTLWLSIFTRDTMTALSSFRKLSENKLILIAHLVKVMWWWTRTYLKNKNKMIKNVLSCFIYYNFLWPEAKIFTF